MSKRNWLIVSAAVLILAVGMVVGLVAQGKKAGVVTPLITPTPAKVEEEKLVKYEDEAGFSFEYPERLVIKDLTGEEEYSILKITSAENPGEMTIKVVDAKYTSVDDWLKKAKEASGAGTSREVTLAGMVAEQIQFDNPRRLVTIAIDEGVMFFVESPLEPPDSPPAGGFWNKAHNTIVSSFALGEKPSSAGEGAVPAKQTPEEEAIFEEEEIVE